MQDAFADRSHRLRLRHERDKIKTSSEDGENRRTRARIASHRESREVMQRRGSCLASSASLSPPTAPRRLDDCRYLFCLGLAFRAACLVPRQRIQPIAIVLLASVAGLGLPACCFFVSFLLFFCLREVCQAPDEGCVRPIVGLE